MFKNRILLILGIAGTLLTTSCREDIVDTKPYSAVGEADAFSTPSLVQLSVNGVYNAYQIGFFNGAGARGYVFGAAYFQQNEARGEDMVNTQAFYQLTYESAYDPTTANNVYYWIDAYRAINRANLVINGLEAAVKNNVITQAVADGYMGEMLFLRAMGHMEMLKHFARPFHLDNGASLGVPYREVASNTKETVDLNTNLGRHTVAESYTKALADLNKAETMLPLKAARAGEDKISKVTKGAAVALKMRLYTNQRNWPKVIDEFTKLAPMGYTIESTFNTVFTSNLANNESIFSIKNSKDTNPGVNGALASQFNGRSLLAISPILWRNPYWLATDKRRTETAVINGAVYTRKYKDIVDFTDAAPLLRYADMVLLAAEAYAREGNLVQGLALLNSVRNRSLANPTTEAYTALSFLTKEDMVRAILAERRIELSAEGKRWGDIHRLVNDDIAPTQGIPAKVPNGFPPASAYTLGTPYNGALIPAIPYTDKRFLWPIPRLETNSNPTLAAQQNPGW